jgi:putative DNA primase/helicase
VSEDDLANLRESGLTDETILENGFCTLTADDGPMIARVLKCDEMAQPCLGGLWMPYHDLYGKPTGFGRLRPHCPRKDKNGKPIRYEQPRGEPSHAYVPVSSAPLLRDGDEPTYLTEGEKKAAAIAQIGRAAIGLGGVWCGCKKDTEELIPDLAAINWTGRVVYIVFDFDEKATTRRSIAAAGRRLARALKAAGAKEVYWVELPPGPGEAKQGVDDFIVSQGEPAFRELVEAAEPVPGDVSFLRLPSGQTDSANAVRLVESFGSDIKYVSEWNKWIKWNGKRWVIDTRDNQIAALAKRIGRKNWKEFSKEAARGKLDEKTTAAMTRFCRSSCSLKGVQAMIALARSEPGVAISPDQLDCDPQLLNCVNGTVNLRTGKLRQHRREDFITALCPTRFDPHAPARRFEKSIKLIFHQSENLIGFMRRFFGYSLTGDVSEQILLIPHGVGSNGKSTLFNAVMYSLGGDYCIKAKKDLLTAKRFEGHSTEMMDLFAKRLVLVSETDDGSRLDEALVKDLTGGDSIRGRRMREDSWQYNPTHKLILATNHKPIIRGTDHAIWRRLALVPFTVTFWNREAGEKGDAGLEQDKSLPGQLKTEAAGILAWMVRGCLEWQRDGLQIPDEVKGATTEYRASQDVVAAFLKQRCTEGTTLRVKASELYKQYCDWTEGGGEDPVSQRRFGEAMTERGFGREHSGGTWYMGLTTRNDP